ncbi:hypothetical protein J6590_072497 [Homalodisca vitripennis]|nr:hypothetical protein J6590_072497 [Homalodisca vitripennis]
MLVHPWAINIFLKVYTSVRPRVSVTECKLSDLPSKSRDVPYDDPSSAEHILQFLHDIEECESGEEIDDSDQDPNYYSSDGDGQSSESKESSPECAVEELIEHEDEFLVIENYVEAMELIKPQLERRPAIPNLPRDFKKVLADFLRKPQEGNLELHDKLPKRKTYSNCPSAKRRKAAYKCVVCSDPICLECSKNICVSYAKNH